MANVYGFNLGERRKEHLDFVRRIKKDGGTYNEVRGRELKKILNKTNSNNPSLSIVPTSKKGSKLYALIPTDGSGDFSVIRNSSKWVLGKNGYLKEYGVNEPAFEFNSDGTYKGILIEEQSTNRVQTSTSLNFSYSNVVHNELAPDGTFTATKVIEDTTTNQQRIHAQDPASRFRFDSKLFTVSVYIKPLGRHTVYLGFYDRTNVFGFTEFNLSTAQIASVDSDNGSHRGSGIDYIGNGWYRIYSSWSYSAYASCCRASFSIAYGSPSTFNNRRYFGIYGNGGFAYDGDGESGIVVWGAQMEEGLEPTSLIHTNGSAVTRASDVIKLENASSLIGRKGSIEISWNQKVDQNLYIGNISSSVLSGVREMKFEYSSTTQSLFIDNELKSSINGIYDWTGMNKIELAQNSNEGYFNTNIRYLKVQKDNAMIVASGGTEIDIVENSTPYRVHIFTSVGNHTLNVTEGSDDIEYLIVAGGGGGGTSQRTEFPRAGGGGGAGGVLSGSIPIQSGSYTVIVGDGGSGGVGDAVAGTNGENSTFFNFTAIGGGGGGGSNSDNAKDGGSGGGGGESLPPGTGTNNQGNNGGSGANDGGGGGGGASSNGVTATEDNGGNGGNGIQSSIIGTSNYYAGGGGGGGTTSGGNGGIGGGGAGGSNTHGENALPNTGGGGGGTGDTGDPFYNGGNGGSGIVIIRYKL